MSSLTQKLLAIIQEEGVTPKDLPAIFDENSGIGEEWRITAAAQVMKADPESAKPFLSRLNPDRLANAGGEAAHLAGMVAGAVYVLSESWRAKVKHKVQVDTLRRQMNQQRDLKAELDRILEKVHTQGIHSLTRSEKKTLKQATEAERRRNTY